MKIYLIGDVSHLINLTDFNHLTILLKWWKMYLCYLSYSSLSHLFLIHCLCSYLFLLLSHLYLLQLSLSFFFIYSLASSIYYLFLFLHDALLIQLIHFQNLLQLFLLFLSFCQIASFQYDLIFHSLSLV